MAPVVSPYEVSSIYSLVPQTSHFGFVIIKAPKFCVGWSYPEVGRVSGEDPLCC
jgi:hypothetical protein